MAGVADLIVNCLRAAGVRMIFGVPGGGGNLDLIAAAGRAGLPFILTTTETGGAMAAIAQAEITGRPGACLTTLGPGAASVVNGVACAFLERAPIFVFTDNYASTDRRYSHQAIDHQAMFAAITRSSSNLSPSGAHQAIAQAFETIGGYPQGPVHLDCAADFESAVAPDLEDETIRVSGPHFDPVELQRRQDLLRHARKPLLIVGLEARRPRDAAAVRALIERHGVPAFVTYKAKGVVPDGHPWFAGLFTNGEIERPLINESDLVMTAGLDDVELLPRPWRYAQDVIAIRPQDNVGVELEVRLLDDAMRRSTWDAGQVRATVDAQRRAISIPTPGLSAQRVVEVAAARLARESRVTVDAGAHMFPATMLWLVSEPNQMLISNGLSTMGFALPAAIGAALLERDRPVVALTGDGGLLMCLGELLTAVRERLRIIIIVFSDASLSLIEIKQQARKLAPAGVALGAIDWPGLARGFGAMGLVAEDEGALERAIEKALAATGPTLIEAKIDRSNYGATMKAIRG